MYEIVFVFVLLLLVLEVDLQKSTDSVWPASKFWHDSPVISRLITDESCQNSDSGNENFQHHPQGPPPELGASGNFDHHYEFTIHGRTTYRISKSLLRETRPWLELTLAASPTNVGLSQRRVSLS